MNSPNLEPESEIVKSFNVEKKENNNHAQNRIFEVSRYINATNIENMKIEKIPPVISPSI
jgi:hypothetical protein